MTDDEFPLTPEEASRLRRLRRFAIRAAVVLSLGVGIILVSGFFLSPSPIREDERHNAAVPVARCLSCHDPFSVPALPAGAPPMPHRPLPTCLFCHRLVRQDAR
ncbi:MAG: hypothetical protein NZ959_11700 [Armatimonadetes bacterium]|nr:hypothetical protein [Armatimonadota bacterium]MDW8122975.1 hypothetical protein [Armatimonadota bacterium]